MKNPLASGETNTMTTNAAADTNGFRQGPPRLNPERAAVQVVVESMNIFKYHLGLFLCCSLVIFLFRQALFSGSVLLITAIATRDASIASILSRFSSDDTIRLMVNSVSSNFSASSYPSIREATKAHGEPYIQLFLLSFSFCAAICSVAMFLVTYTMILSTTFIAVSQYYVRHSGGRFQRVSMMGTLLRGCKVGKGRVGRLILWWLLARESLIIPLFCCLHRDTFRKDRLRAIRLLIETMLTPFTFTAPVPMVITNKYEHEQGRIWAFWEVPASVLASFFIFIPYVVIMNRERTNANNNSNNVWWLVDGVKGGQVLSKLVSYANLKIKFVETVICGPLGWMLCCYCYGSDFALVFQALAEVFFIVTYVVFYFVAMFEGGEGLQRGARFGLGDIQRFLNRL